MLHSLNTSLLQLLDYFTTIPWHIAAAWLLLENILLFLASLAFGYTLLALFKRERVSDLPEPLQWQEIAWALSCVLLNTVVTLAGWWLWRNGWIIVRRDVGWRTLLDVAILTLAMDLSMYLSHRIAHIKWIYPWMHATHHHYDKPRPLNLFVLNPFEVLGFGALWLAVIAIYPSSWLGIIIYLTLNLLFGTIGHLGVEPLPKAWVHLPLIRHISSSTFHARHHQDGTVNFGFYTDLWDRLYRHYIQTFGKLDPEATAPPSRA